MHDNDQLGPVARRLAATQRVLCVEDEADIAAFLRAYFRAAGFDLVHIDPENPDEVVDAAVAHGPDAILLDLRLRGFSGTEAYRRLRSDDRFNFVPVIMVSADIRAEPSFESPAGLDAFVTKPFNTNVLADLVRARLAVASTLAERGRHADLEVMTQEYLDARLFDEIRVAGSTGAFAFALVRLLSQEHVVAEVGRDGRDHVVRSLVRRSREALPPQTVIGLTDSDELALVLPMVDMETAGDDLRPVLEELRGCFELPGGATVTVHLAAGVAAFPDSADDPDGLFMAADAALADAVDAEMLLRLAP